MGSTRNEGAREKLTAHSSASVHTRTRPPYSCSNALRSKKCVADLVATTWTSTCSCWERRVGEDEVIRNSRSRCGAPEAARGQ